MQALSTGRRGAARARPCPRTAGRLAGYVRYPSVREYRCKRWLGLWRKVELPYATLT